MGELLQGEGDLRTVFLRERETHLGFEILSIEMSWKNFEICGLASKSW